MQVTGAVGGKRENEIMSASKFSVLPTAAYGMRHYWACAKLL